MGSPPIRATRADLRRLAVAKQHLSGGRPTRVTDEGILALVRDLPYVQWDPVTIVAPSHLLSLWARLGSFSPAQLNRLLWSERRLLLHWLPMASIVVRDDFPLYNSLAARYPESLTHSWGSQRTRAQQFLTRYPLLRDRMLTELRSGPLTLGDFKDHSRTKRDDGEWAPSSDVAQMLFHLSMSGEVVVVGHRGAQNLWGLARRYVPEWGRRPKLSTPAFEEAAAERAIRALGAATAPEVTHYFPRGRYEDLRAALASLEQKRRIHRISVDAPGSREPRYVHEDDLPLLEGGTREGETPRVTLLPPFDNLLGHPARTQAVFGFQYVREQFLPKAKRRFGTYVLPILYGDRLIGRIDPRLDKVARTLHINSVHTEEGAPEGREVATALGETIDQLREFVGATSVKYTPRVPVGWKAQLR